MGYQISLIEERPFLFNFRSKRLSFLHLVVFLSFLSLPRFLGFPRMDFREWITAVGVFFFFLVFFPHEVRPRQLLCWRRPRWFSTSSDLWLFSLILVYCSMIRMLTVFFNLNYGCQAPRRFRKNKRIL